MTQEHFTLKKGDNDFYIIYKQDKFFLSMKHKDEAKVVLDYLNLNEMMCNSIVIETRQKDKIINDLNRKVWKLRKQLKDNGIREEFN